MSKQANENSRDWTISWEEALEREMEYQKRMENKLPQQSVDSMVSPLGSQEHQQKENTQGLKRKVTPESFPQPARKIFERQMVLPKSANTQLNTSQRIYVQKPPFQQRKAGKLPSQQFQNKRHPPQQSSDYQSPLQLLQCHQSFSHLRQVQNAKTLPEGFLTQRAPRKVNAVCWCNLCSVKCMTLPHLELHRQGKKHKANVEKVRGGKKNSGSEEIWCPDCNIKCMNEFSWNQHHMGKKHLATVAKKAIEASSGAGPVIKVGTVGCVQEPQKARCTEEQKIAKINVGMPDNRLTSSVIHNQKLRTSNWPNCI